MFAVIKSGGKQYRVVLGSILKLEKIDQKENSDVVFKEVLMIKNETSYEIGSPYLNNVEVKGKILENKKNKKIIVFKKRRRHNSRRKNGHRQSLSVIKINEIIINGKTFKDKEKPEKANQKKTDASSKNKTETKSNIKIEKKKPKVKTS
ncbi:MAG: 50S ribosomal protein L21 [Alphaproteobacteria bacterium MarineAlpha9_Bin4]|mgnify:CR=1 FL=1|nr:MAG: 50S ribosomal protein L21 [Alphaproteobacteria bacterium MarineAlpha9_Bin4]|tara:strand:- start:681 stop:1127 length:447 start_codon:yes stop_codon:yes gene_type:complete